MRVKKLEIDYEYLIRLARVGEGKYSVVYRNNDKAYKYMKDNTIFKSKEINGILETNNMFKELYKECGNIIIPIEALYVNYGDKRTLKGYTSDYIDGYTLPELKEQELLFEQDEFECLIEPLIKTIETLSKNNIYMQDLHGKNIMYEPSKKRFVFIDTDFWCYDDKNIWLEDDNFDKFDKSFNRNNLIRKR